MHAGRYFWNCGIFVWSARTILDELARYEPELHAGLVQIGDALGTPQADEVLAKVFPGLKSTSIDYAVLERARKVCVVEAKFEWDDVGSWEALARLEGVDAQGNTLVGPHCCVETRNCIVHTEPGHIVVSIDVEDLLIGHTADATFVARRGDEQAMRRIIAELKSRGLDHLL